MNWIEVGIVGENEPIDVGGVNPWSHECKEAGAGPVELPHPSYRHQLHRMDVYKLDVDGRKIVFACGELSPSVWGFYVPKPDTQDRLSDDLEALLVQKFGNHAGDARTFLLCYSGKEANRVRLAIVALSGGKLDKLAYYTERAQQDYRDVLYWAEYPREPARPYRLTLIQLRVGADRKTLGELFMAWRKERVSVERVESAPILDSSEPLTEAFEGWRELKLQMLPGDELWTFRSSEEDRKNRADWQGLLIVRDDKLFDFCLTA